MFGKTSDISFYSLRGLFFLCVREYILRTGQEVVPEKEAPQGMLDTSTHLHQILQDIFTWQFIGFDVHHTHSDQ